MWLSPTTFTGVPMKRYSPVYCSIAIAMICGSDARAVDPASQPGSAAETKAVLVRPGEKLSISVGWPDGLEEELSISVYHGGQRVGNLNNRRVKERTWESAVNTGSTDTTYLIAFHSKPREDGKLTWERLDKVRNDGGVTNGYSFNATVEFTKFSLSHDPRIPGYIGGGSGTFAFNSASTK